MDAIDRDCIKMVQGAKRIERAAKITFLVLFVVAMFVGIYLTW